MGTFSLKDFAQESWGLRVPLGRVAPGPSLLVGLSADPSVHWPVNRVNKSVKAHVWSGCENRGCKCYVSVSLTGPLRASLASESAPDKAPGLCLPGGAAGPSGSPAGMQRALGLPCLQRRVCLSLFLCR